MTTRRSPWFSIPFSRDDARLRLICFPHGGGGPQAYRAWGERLPGWIEVCAIQPPGRGARLRELPIRVLSRMRSEIADVIMGNIEPPYAFFGHSVGALIAFEVARELERRGAAAPLRVFLSALAAPDAKKCRGMDLLHLQDDQTLLKYLADLGHAAAGAMADQDFLKLMLEAVRADFELAQTHSPDLSALLKAPITVLGGEHDHAVSQPGLAAWKKFAAGGFSQTTFAGDHFYTETARDELLEFLASELSADIANLPQSLSFGPREDYPGDCCLHELFRLQVSRTPNDVAVIDPANLQTPHLTFAELDKQSDLLARRLLALGSAPQHSVAIFMEPSSEFVIAYLAALKAGAAYLPIPTATPDAALSEILEATAPVAVTTAGELAGRLPEHWRDSDRCISLGQQWAEELLKSDLGKLEEAPHVEPTYPAYVVMTSGTTGKPKGIVCPHRGAVNSYWWRYTHLPYGDYEKEACNVFFVWEVLRPILQGHPALIVPSDVIFDPRRLIAFLSEHSVTRVLFTPSLLDAILVQADDTLAKSLPALRTVILNGEVVTTALAQRFAEALPHVRLVNDYSISECHDVATSILGADVHERAGQQSYLPVGRPMSNVNVYVLDESLQPVPYGVKGEIYVGGDGMAQGYLNEPERTAERFLPDPFAAELETCNEPSRMFRTGDVGRILPDGSIEISGRAHFMVKLRGYTVVPAAIEAEMRAVPQCSAAAIVTVDDHETGQPDHLIAYAVPDTSNEPLDLAKLRQHLKERLPHYAVPREIIQLPGLPIDPATGKLDRRKLPSSKRKLHCAGGGSQPPSRADLVADLAAIWQRILRVETLDLRDNFFDLGGHSLLAGEMSHAVTGELGVVVDVIDVFDKPVFENYAAHIQSRLASGQPSYEVPSRTVTHRQSNLRAQTAGSADIAVIGMAGRFPGAETPEELWQLAADGRTSIRHFDDDELHRLGVPEKLLSDPDYIRRGAVLDDVADFDPRFWGLSQAEATIMDPQHRLLLECCWHALEDSGHRTSDVGGNIGVYAGCYLPGYLIHHLGAEQYLDAANPALFQLTETGNDKDYLASRVAYFMNLCGPAIGVQTSCSTGLVAIAEAAAALRAGRCDMALAGASSITFPQGGYVSAEGHIGTGSGTCRAFDVDADGTILGDGVGIVVLRRLEDALDDGDRVLAVIKGHAVNNDGAMKAGYSSPSSAGQATVIKRALSHAGIDPSSVAYIEAHGTGTRLGDPIEVRGLAEAYGSENRNVASRKKSRCALGSIKPNIGHSNIAAGVAGFIKAVQAVRHGEIPPLAKFQQENPELHLDETPFFIPTELQPWPGTADVPRRAGISSFGIGGTNCHVVIEAGPNGEYTGDGVAKKSDATLHILPISAKTQIAVRELATRLAAYLRNNHTQPLGDIAATLQSGRTEFEYRTAIVADSHLAAAAAFTQTGQPTNDNDPSAEHSRLAAIARQWESGVTVDWARLRGSRSFRRVPLPGYPFARERCWPEKDRAQVQHQPVDCRIERETRLPWQEMFYLPSWGRTTAPPIANETWQGTYIFLAPQSGSARGFAEELARSLNGYGALTEILSLGTSSGLRKASLPDLVDSLESLPGPCRMIDLISHDATAGCSGEFDAGDAAALTADLAGFLSALSNCTVTRAPLSYWLIGNGFLKLNDEPSKPLLAPLIGPLITVSQERPRLQARLIDIGNSTGHGTIEMLADELRAIVPRAEPFVALRGRHRWVERIEALPEATALAERGAARLSRSTGPHVITGGTGRIGLALTKRLISDGSHVVLLSRRHIEHEEAWRRAQFGSRADLVRTISCDVANRAALSNALIGVTRHDGGLGGIFHAAGLADLRYIEATTAETVAAEFAPKVVGMMNLRRALEDLQRQELPLPDFVLAFSSLASVLGGLGMAGYAAANRYLDATIAENSETCGVPFICANFDDWDFEYGKEQVGAYARTRKGLSLPVDDGIAAIEACLGLRGIERVVVAATSLQKRIDKWMKLPALATFEEHETGALAGGAETVESDMVRPQAAPLEADFLTIVLLAYAKVIGSRDLAPDSNFFELGGDSLLAAQLAMELRGTLRGNEAGIGDIFDFPTPRLLSGHLKRTSEIDPYDKDEGSKGSTSLSTA